MVQSGVLKHGINEQRRLNRGTDGNEALSVGERHRRGHVWDNFLVEKHPLPLVGAGDGFQSSFLPRERVSAPRCPCPDYTPLLSRMEPEHKPDHLRSPSRIVHRCIATEPILLRLHWDIWPCSNRHLFLLGRSCTKLGSLICPFVVRISCSTSCDVTD